MAAPRDGRAEPAGSRMFTPEEAAECSARLRKRIAEVQNPELKSARYDDPRIVALESSIRATVRDIFRDGSPEARDYGGFRFVTQRIRPMSNFLHGTDNRVEILSDLQAQLPQSLPRAAVALEGLINRIAERTVARRTPAMPRESRRFDPVEASRTFDRLRRRVQELQTLNVEDPDYVSKAEIALDNAVSTVNDEFGERSDEASAFSSALIQATSALTLARFRHNVAERDKASAAARVREAASRLHNLQRIVGEKTVYESAPTPTITAPPPPSRRVFLVHGHKEEAKLAVARLLERLDLQPIILHEQPDMNRTIIEKFEAHADVGFAVILMTGDDRGGPAAASTDSYQPRARQNVLLEMGFFLGRLGRGHVCVLYEPGVEMPSDYAGVLYKPLDSAGNWKWELAREIDVARIPVDFNRLK